MDCLICWDGVHVSRLWLLSHTNRKSHLNNSTHRATAMLHALGCHDVTSHVNHYCAPPIERLLHTAACPQQ